jgi:hypothetical protein
MKQLPAGREDKSQLSRGQLAHLCTNTHGKISNLDYRCSVSGLGLL